MAEGILKDMLKESQYKEKIEIKSAGLATFGKEPPSPQAIEVMRDRKIDISDHLSTQLTKGMIEEADIILTMTVSHRGQIQRAVSDARGKAYTLLELALGEEKDISDPFGMPVEVYKSTAQELESALREAFPQIIKKISG